MAGNELEILIRARDEAAATMAKINKEISNLGGTSGAVKGQVAGLSDTLGRDLTGALYRVSPAMGSIVSAAGPLGLAVAGLTVGVKALKEAWDLAAGAARFEDVQQSYYKINGGIEEATASLEAMRQASLGTVNDLKLMQGMNLAKMMGVSATGEETARLMALAVDRAKGLGITTEYAFDSLMRGLGRMQPLLLDNLAINVKINTVNEEYARTLGKSVDSLSDMEKKAALLQAVLEQAPEGLEDATASAAQNLLSMEVSVDNMNIAVGQLIEKWGLLSFGDIKQGLADEIALMARNRLKVDDIMGPYYEAVNKIGDPFAKLSYTMRLNDLATQFKWVQINATDLKIALDDLVPSVGANAAADAAAQAALVATSDAMITLAGQAYLLGDAVRSIPSFVQIGIEFRSITSGLNAAMGAGVTNPLYSQNLLIGANGQMNYGPDSGRVPSLTPLDTKYIEGVQASNAAARRGGGGLSDYEQMLRQQAADMRSLVEQILQPTEVTSQDMADTAAGRYMDKWDEYGRKMRAIAADQGSVWRQMVPQEILAQGEDAIRGWAEQQQKLFYSGRMPEEINWGDFVARAKEEIANKQAREAMVQEAMRQLQAAGVSMSGAELQAMIGGTPGASTGVEMAGAFGTGLVANDTALAVTSAFQEQMKAQQETWTLVGTLCISWFVIGIKKGISPQTGREIVNALFPWFAEKLDEAGYTAGAIP